MRARIGADLDERLEPRHQVVAGAQRPGVAVEVAVVVARGRLVGEHRILKFGALRRPLRGDFEAIEALRHAEGAAERGEDRKAREPGLHVRAARIVGADNERPLADQRSRARHIEPPGDFAVEGRSVELGRLAVHRVAAAQGRRDLVALPVRTREQFGCDCQ
jgi:hypothetical protein